MNAAFRTAPSVKNVNQIINIAADTASEMTAAVEIFVGSMIMALLPLPILTVPSRIKTHAVVAMHMPIPIALRAKAFLRNPYAIFSL